MVAAELGQLSSGGNLKYGGIQFFWGFWGRASSVRFLVSQDRMTVTVILL